jgi:hypothetical protein
MQVNTITTPAKIHRIGRTRGANLGASEKASMKLSHVKKTACPLG